MILRLWRGPGSKSRGRWLARVAPQPGSLHRYRFGRVHRREPAVSIVFASAGKRQKFLLQLFGDGAAESSSDLDPVDRADRRNLHRRAGEEHLIGDVASP